MTRTEFAQALKTLTPAQALKARELAKGLKEMGSKDVYSRAIAYAQEG